MPSKKSQHSSESRIPAPFTKAPPSLDAFLQQLNPAQVHITHIDRHPASYKRKIFSIPVLLNGIIAILLLWRLFVAVPKYFLLTKTLLGYSTSDTVDVERTTRGQQLGILLRRTAMMAVDFLLFRFIAPWPLTFFAEQPANPVSWRWKLGFREEEIVVRASRYWGTEELMKGVKQGNESPFFKTRILPAIEPDVIRKTGYLTMDASWDLEFELMLDAHTLGDRGDLRIEELDRVVLAYQEEIGWLIWKWEGEGDMVDMRRKKIVAFKERLTSMGKESLFWKWMEVVEQERGGDGGFTQEKQEQVARRVQAEFQRHGVDFEELARSVGGLDELPADAKMNDGAIS